MATPYTSIFQRAVFRFRDFRFAELNELDVNTILQAYLESAVSDFVPVCLKDLTLRDTDSGFSEDLSDEEQEILGLGIAYYWLSSKLFDQEVLRNSMSTKDYQFFSPANLLREFQELRNEVRKEYRDRITQYSFHHAPIAELSVTNKAPGGSR